VTLFQDHVLPLCAPSFLLRQPGGIIDWQTLPSDDFIHTAWGSNFPSHPVWGDWMRVQVPARQLDESKEHRVAASRLAIDFARLGLGVALYRRRLAQADLRTGRLLIASHHQLSLGDAYAAAYPHAKARKAGLKALLDWRVSDPQTQGPHR
jgi:LysR family glycine cleavage system transcriptional activator